jgi:hypothetical protein
MSTVHCDFCKPANRFPLTIPLFRPASSIVVLRRIEVVGKQSLAPCQGSSLALFHSDLQSKCVESDTVSRVLLQPVVISRRAKILCVECVY